MASTIIGKQGFGSSVIEGRITRVALLSSFILALESPVFLCRIGMEALEDSEPWRLTIRPSRCRFAARLNSGVRRHIMLRIGIYSILVLLVSLAAYELLVRAWNEHRAQECDALIVQIELHRRINGQYPKSLDAIGSQNSDDVCHYQPLDGGYIFVVSAFTLQTYEYNSGTQKWRWD